MMVEDKKETVVDFSDDDDVGFSSTAHAALRQGVPPSF